MQRIILKMLLLETVVWLLLYFDGFQNMLCENEQKEDDWPDHYILEYLSQEYCKLFQSYNFCLIFQYPRHFEFS